MERSNTARIILVIAIVGAIGLAAGGLYYLFLRPSGPPPVGEVPSPIGSPAVSASAQPSADAEPSDAASADPAPSGGAAGALDGTWTVDPSIGSFDYEGEDFSGSWVGYRVQEELAGIGGADAVGRTPDVSGSLTFAGTQVTGVDITADLTSLESDDDRRDGQLERQALETGRFPEATFAVTSPIDLGTVPADGASVQVDATGDLTIHGVTNSVTIPITATRSGDTVTVAGSIDILFADYGMEKPQSFIVLSVDDHGIMEFQLHFTRADA
jgi:polyisoprenoid-binding protein YceI